MNLEQSFYEIKQLIDTARYKALTKVNTELVQLYWSIGSFISERMKAAVWGEKIIEQLAEYLNNYGPI
jgi:hypothetical protein